MLKKFVCAALCAAVFGFANPSVACGFRMVTQCEAFAMSKYFGEVDSASAIRLAENACARVSDLEVLKFLWSKHATSNSPAHAMDFSIEEAAGLLDGKLELVRYAWSLYLSTEFHYSRAATKGAAGAARIRDLNCVVLEVAKLKTEERTTARFDQAFDICAKRGY